MCSVPVWRWFPLTQFVSEDASSSYRAFFDGIPTRVYECGAHYLRHSWGGFFSVEAMFDTNYHLAAESRAVYTTRLLETLRSVQTGCLSKGLEGRYVNAS